MGQLVEVGLSLRAVKGRNGKKVLKNRLVSLTLRNRRSAVVSETVSDSTHHADPNTDAFRDPTDARTTGGSECGSVDTEKTEVVPYK